MRARLIVTVALLVAPGCMHVPLRNNTTNEARTVGDIYQQQVLNNLAMFAYDPNSLPYFSFANQGSTQINDLGSVGVMPTWSRLAASVPFLFTSLGTSFSAQREATAGFTLTPVNDPRKLELMRCAYQKAIAGCNGMPPATTCPDCQTRFKTFYTGDPDGNIGEGTTGILTSECLGGPCWLGVGCKKDVPKGCPCQLVGNYCGVYVWVLPGQRNELSKLTLAILDYAINPFPTQVRKTVQYFIDERGMPATRDAAVGVVTANIAVSERNESLLNIPRADAVTLRDELQKKLDNVNTEIDDAQKQNRTTTLEQLFSDRQIIQGQLNFLEKQLEVGGLKNEYIGGPSAGSIGSPAGPGVLELRQDLNTLAPR